MVINPIYLIALPLAFAFSLGIFNLFGKNVAKAVFMLGVTANLAIAVLLFYNLSINPEPIMVMIGGFLPPKGINLLVGYTEALFALIIHSLFFVGAVYWLAKGAGDEYLKGITLFLLLSLGVTGIIFTNDIFNLFVFIEITSIASYALVSFYNKYSLEAAFKFLIAGSISAIFLLIGILLVYKTFGVLNLSMIAEKVKNLGPDGYTPYMLLAVAFIGISFLIELELFPFNGWALDVYQGASPAVSSVLAGAVSKGFFLVFLKLNLVFRLPEVWQLSLIYLGLATFLFSQFFAWRQDDFRRLLGYSSVAQLGLLVVIVGLMNIAGVSTDLLYKSIIFLVISHALAKSGLFWISGLSDERLDKKRWSSFLSGNPWLKGFVFISILSLLGVPPFPGFWGKFYLLMGINAIPRALFYQIISILLIGSVAEIVYYIKWWTELGKVKKQVNYSLKFIFPVIATVSGLIVIGLIEAYNNFSFISNPEIYLFVIGTALLVWLLSYAGTFIQWLLTVVGFVVALFFYKGAIASFTGIFNYLILVGAIIFIFAAQWLDKGEKEDNTAFYPLFTLVVAGLIGVVSSKSWFTFFFNWEIMAWASYLVVIQSSYLSKKAGWIYAVISGFGAMAILGAMAIMYAYSPVGTSFLLPYADVILPTTTIFALVSVLMFIGFGAKIALVPLHIWARDTYSESPDAFTAFFSGVVSKIGIFGFMLFLIQYHKSFGTSLYFLAWLGTIAAFSMTLIAVFQEDAKKLLAYSSIGQVAYIIVTLSLLSPLGWSAAFYHTINHALFKGLLFLTVAGVISRTGTRNMYEMGGLIKKMPFSFVSVLIGIIALSGIPPLSGFGGKWLMYNGLLENHWYFMLVVNMLASVIAFLYLYRLIHSIFLGQLTEKNENVKEAPIPVIISQVVLWIGILAISVKPSLILDPIKVVVEAIFSQQLPLTTDSSLGLVSKFGQWNAMGMMILVIVIFVVGLIIFWLSSPKATKIDQLDIGYSGEVPEDPDELHYSWDFYSHYFKGMSWFMKIKVEPVYRWLWDSINGTVEVARRIYTGSSISYAYYILITAIIILYVISGVV